MPKIRFKEKGRWSNNNGTPVLEVLSGEVHDVSDHLARSATEAGRADYYIESKAVENAGPVSKDDEAGPVKKAEGEPKDKPKRRGRPPKSESSE